MSTFYFLLSNCKRPIGRGIQISIETGLSQGSHQQPKEHHSADQRKVQPLLPWAIIHNAAHIWKSHDVTKAVTETWRNQAGCSQEQKCGKPAKERRVHQLSDRHQGCIHESLARSTLLHKELVSMVDMCYKLRKQK